MNRPKNPSPGEACMHDAPDRPECAGGELAGKEKEH
eukprot:CAMPEP_0115834252 /NCGR_PEP_ID=MMETSP0287-20121206/3589_1 /TAXON_ID=412157 /ORGANISM="Chrysochromulina rotalis, Strain UIO044" /LENGTH=35 /DNA_ID= /DNA_START= /DNA_END= /DNA_ORIENTATION=